MEITATAPIIASTPKEVLDGIINGMPVIVPFNNLHILPERNDFIINTEHSIILDKIRNNMPLEFMPNDVLEDREYMDNYCINVFGVLKSGAAACVRLTNIPIYVDMLLGKMTLQDIRKDLLTRELNFLRIEERQAKPLHKFHIHPQPAIRVFFKTLAHRKIFIGVYGRGVPSSLSSDDVGRVGSYYYKLIARTYGFNCGDWNTISNYRCATHNTPKILTFNVDIVNYVPYEGVRDDLMSKDNLIVASWDIETEFDDPNGAVPTPEDNFDLFMICTSFFWQHSVTPLVEYCCVSVPTTPKRGVCIQCSNEYEVLVANNHVWGAMKLDISSAYNGASFDWPLTLSKLKQHNLLSDFYSLVTKAGDSRKADDIMKWTFSEVKVKINAERDLLLPRVGTIPGIIDIDSMSCMTQLYPKSEVGRGKSLNHFLSINGLPSKDDMPYKRMFQIYRDSKKRRDSKLTPDANLSLLMGDVAYYCTIDCLRPQQLLVKRTLLSEKREMATLASVSLRDTFYRADGMKVNNLVSKFCHQISKNIGYDIYVSSQSIQRGNHEKEHFPGGWVFPPKYGLNQESPVTGLDFRSLYPSLIMAYNLSPDMLVTDPKFAVELEGLGYQLYKIGPVSYEVGEKKGETCNQQCTISGWTVRHDITIKPVPELPGQRMGVMPQVVKMLFDLRVPIKNEFVRLENIIEDMGVNNLAVYQTTIDGIERKYTFDEIHFFRNKIEAKQKAVKLLANTVYGIMGNFRNPLYSLLIASGVTEAGRNSVKTVASYVGKCGFGLQYGDTDSVYLTCPEMYYTDVRTKYIPMIASRVDANERTRIRVEYWSELVRIAVRVMTGITKNVNIMLEELTGTKFLAMAYEEVGMPCALLGKKKYIMTPHLKEPNFGAGVGEFLRGIDVVKQGKTAVVKRLGIEFIRECLSPSNERAMLAICEDYVKKLFSIKPDPADFKQTAAYKPHKANIAVNKFIARMQKVKEMNPEAPFELPEPGDKFDYVVVRRDQDWTISGKKITLSKGDKMEFVSVFMAGGYELDLEHYVSGEFIGAFARFIAPSDEFKPTSELDHDGYDKYIVDKATKHLSQLCAKYAGVDKVAIKAVGLANKRIYRNIVKQSNSKLTIAQALVFQSDQILDPEPQEYATRSTLDILLQQMSLYKLVLVSAKSFARLVHVCTKYLTAAQIELRQDLERINAIKRERDERVRSSVLSLRTVLLSRQDNGMDIIVDDINSLSEEDAAFVDGYTARKQSYDLQFHVRGRFMALMRMIQAERAKQDIVSYDVRDAARADAAAAAPVPEYQWK